MARVEAGVDDFDDLVVAFLGGLVGAGHFECGRVLQDGRTCGGSIVLGHGRDAARNGGGLDALRALDSSKRGRGCLDREALERVGVLTQRRDARGGDGFGDGGGDPLPGLRAFSPGLELDDDRGWLVTRRGWGGVRGLPRAGRGGAGAGMRSPVSCERSRNGECCHAKGAGDHQGECRRSAVGHLSLTSLTTVFDKLGTKSASTIMGSFSHVRSMRCRQPRRGLSRSCRPPTPSASRARADTPGGRPFGRPLGVSHQHSASSPK